MSSGQADWSRIVASDPNPPRREAMSALGVTVKDNVGVAASSDVVFIATKPQQVAEVLREIAGTLYESGALVVSIAAGVTLNTMFDALVGAGNANAGISHVRVMPNTPCFVGETAAAMALSGGVSTAEKECVERLLSSVGKCHVVDEKLLDAVTGLSGSGPAYVFLTIEAMADGGVAAGLPRPVALSLAAQTVLGGAKVRARACVCMCAWSCARARVRVCVCVSQTSATLTRATPSPPTHLRAHTHAPHAREDGARGRQAPGGAQGHGVLARRHHHRRRS